MEDTLFIEIQRLCQLLHERGLRELSVTRPSFSLRLTALQAGMATVMPAPVAAAPAKAEEPAAPAGYAVTSPIIGTFYRASSPDFPSFVEVGDQVEAGQTIGIVEAMKVFNEITTDKAGIVSAIIAQNGQLVKVDEPLIILNPLT